MPYGATVPSPFAKGDPWGWQVTEHEEAFELRPGLEQVAGQVVKAMVHLGRGEPAHGISKAKRLDNPYWPTLLAEQAGRLDHERYVILMPLALSRTQDDKGRVRWTLFGGSEQGPGRAFWRSFLATPDRENRDETALAFFCSLLATAYGETADLARAGFRIFALDVSALPWSEGTLPAWTEPLLWKTGRSLRSVKYLLTFRPFATLPEAVQRAYLAGDLHLLPFPGSLLFWGTPDSLRLRQELPLATQIPLLSLVERHEGPHGFRVPQSGWMHEPRAVGEQPGDHHGPVRNAYRRSHRTARVPRDAEHDQLVSPREDRLAHVLFDSSETIGLYGKPMARNVQLWTDDFHLLLDGPSASRASIMDAAATVREGGLFGYRFHFPAQRVGAFEVYWHRPLVACLPEGAGRPVVIPEAPLGYFTAYRADRPEPEDAVVLWPRLLHREPYEAAATLFTRPKDPRPQETARNCRKLLEARALLGGKPLDRGFARRLLTIPEHETLDQWLERLPLLAADSDRARALADELRRGLTSGSSRQDSPSSLTYARTARRPFEVAFWKAIAALSGGRYPNRNNADCTHDTATRKALSHLARDLEPLGDDLLRRHTRAIASAGMTGRALAGDLPFHWRTDFDYNWSDGWRSSQGPEPRERDLIVIIPGRDRSRAVIMADHYDTAYMEDSFREKSGGGGPRLAAPGSDDNTSATAALLVAAPVLLELSREGRLGCDVWLVHLTGEEFPSDCLGARHLAECLVEGTLAARLPDGRGVDLSKVRVEGVFVLDMVAHDNPHRRGVYQAAPGTSRESLQLAFHVHQANEAWNASVPIWNRSPVRRRRIPGAGATSSAPPPTAPHPLMHGEVRPHDDPKSTLFNTDGQIFSDAGIPVVLFMEDYDIDRTGYHDSHDTLAGIDLDFGSALVAIAIETVARAAGASPA
jgi:hypothetical protein